MRITVFAIALATASLSMAAGKPIREEANRSAQVVRENRDATVSSPQPATPVGPQIACHDDSECHSSDGHQGHCFTESLAAQYTQSFRDCQDGRAWRAVHTPGTCVFDECRNNDSPGGSGCPSGRLCGTLDMVPFPQRICLPAACNSDFSCRRQVGGHCASYLNAGRCRPGGWSCSYPSDVCAPRDPNRMCPVQPGMLPFCAPRNNRFVCVQEPAI